MIQGFFAADYQVHSIRSHDGKATVREQCLRAIDLGLDEIGFSEHKDFDPFDPVVDHFDYDAYSADIAAARREFGQVLAIRKGIEVDYQRWFEDQIAEYLRDREFDFVIGSVHYVDRRMLMTPWYLAGLTKEGAYRQYFQAVRDSVDSGLIDIVGHLEYANRRGIPALGPYDPAPFEEQVSELFAAMIARGVALEINTAGLRQGAGATYPCAQHVALYARCGGTLLTIGSDSHQPADLADAYAVAARLAVDNGLSSLHVWEGRRPRPVSLRPPA